MTLDLQAIQAELEDRIKMTQHHPETVPTFMWVLAEHLAKEEEIPVITGTVTPDQLWAMLAGLERGEGEEPVRVAVDCVITVTPRPQLNLDFLNEVGYIQAQHPLADAETTQAPTDMDDPQITFMPYGPGIRDGYVLSYPGADDLRVPCDLEWGESSTSRSPMLLSRFHDDLTQDDRKEWIKRISDWLRSVGREDITQGPLR